MPPGDIHQAVERRDQDHAGNRPLRGELHRDAAAEAAAEDIDFPAGLDVIEPAQGVGDQRLLGRRAATVVDLDHHYELERRYVEAVLAEIKAKAKAKLKGK